MSARSTVAVLLAAVSFAVMAPATDSAGAPGPVIARTTIGYSVRHRPIVAYHLGNPAARTTALIIGQMHGNERAGVTLVNAIVHGGLAITGINLWVVPTMNPDGNAADTRQNAHHVDLNRNWPNRWTELAGAYNSGPKALSEPETRAMYAFLKRVRPRYIVSIHQPLGGVDTTDGGALDPSFRNRLARNLGLKPKAFRCWSVCHGSMTGWYTARRYGIADTVEFGPHPTKTYLTGRARLGIITALGGGFRRV